MDKALIRLQHAWVTGRVLETGYLKLGEAGYIQIEHVEKNPDGDGYFIDGYMDIKPPQDLSPTTCNSRP
jgi:hypothetical protein